MFQVFKFVLDLLYDSALVGGLFFTTNKVMDVVKYSIQVYHEQRMAQLNNEFYGDNKPLR